MVEVWLIVVAVVFLAVGIAIGWMIRDVNARYELADRVRLGRALEGRAEGFAPRLTPPTLIERLRQGEVGELTGTRHPIVTRPSNDDETPLPTGERRYPRR